MMEMTKSQMQQMNSGIENNHINEITSKKKVASGAFGEKAVAESCWKLLFIDVTSSS
jgi:hypothetical protein